MSNGIGRLRKLGIALQPTFGSAAPSATNIFALQNAPSVEVTVNKVMNVSALGSSYQINDVMGTTRFSTLNLEFKIDENLVPLLLKQRFTIASVTTSESTAYQHTLSYSDNTNTWYTLFLQDDQRQDYVIKDVLFDNLDFTFDQDFVRASATAIGSVPTETSVTVTASQPNEFVGRMVSFLDDDVPGTVTSTSVLSITSNMDFGLNAEETRYGLGSADLAVLRLTADKYMFSVTKLKDGVSYYDDHLGVSTKQFRVKAISTDRFVGSTTGTRPTIQFDVPRAKIETYTETADLDDLIQESFDLTALRPVGVADTPVKITVVNSVASY